MRTGDLIAKFVRDLKLPAHEIQELIHKLNKQQSIVNIWGKYLAGNKPYFDGNAEDSFALSDHPYFMSHYDSSVASGSYIDLNLAETGDDVWASSATSPVTEITIPESGLYNVSVDIVWEDTPAGAIEKNILVNLNTVPSIGFLGSSTVNCYQVVSATKAYYKGDVVTVSGYQASGGNLTYTINICVVKIRSLPSPITVAGESVGRESSSGY